MRAWDGRGDKTLLTDLVLNYLEMPSEEALLNHLYQDKISNRKLLWLVPLLFEAAEAGDQPAIKLIIQLGEEVATTANALIKRFSMQGMDVEVGLAGGVFKGKGSLLIRTATRGIHRVAPKARIRKTRYEPVVGAALLALESAGGVVSDELYDLLDRSLPGQLIYQGEAGQNQEDIHRKASERVSTTED
jgi:N-acetylglucosamine kinase-like BadF-type ATPase